LDSDYAIIAGLWEFTGKHGLIKFKVVIKSRYISGVDTMGNAAVIYLLLLS
jgi:hypothetical protein